MDIGIGGIREMKIDLVRTKNKGVDATIHFELDEYEFEQLKRVVKYLQNAGVDRHSMFVGYQVVFDLLTVLQQSRLENSMEGDV